MACFKALEDVLSKMPSLKFRVESISFCCEEVDAVRFPSALLSGVAVGRISVNDFFPLVLDSRLMIAW